MQQDACGERDVVSQSTDKSGCGHGFGEALGAEVRGVQGARRARKSALHCVGHRLCDLHDTVAASTAGTRCFQLSYAGHFSAYFRGRERMARYRSKSWRNYRPEAPGAVESPPPPASLNCRILGIDPGSRRLGFGVIEVVGADTHCVTHGCIQVDGLPMATRLARLHAGVRDLVAQHAPQEIAIEKVFVSRNVDSALKLGQARGAALAALDGLEIAEYAPRAIKLATVGFGGADKMQIAHMMRAVLKVEGRLTADAADALAVALCHAQHRRLVGLISDRFANAVHGTGAEG